MSDLISTQEAVIKIIDTAMRKIMSGEQKLTKEYEQSVKDAVNVILDTARCKIIHCRECVYGEQDYDGWWYCRSFGCQVGNENGSGFCSDAERKNNV